MRPRSLLVLALVVAALGAWVWFVERDLPSSQEREEQAKKVLAWEADDVVAVTIDGPEGEVRLRREEEAENETGAMTLGSR